MHQRVALIRELQLQVDRISTDRRQKGCLTRTPVEYAGDLLTVACSSVIGFMGNRMVIAQPRSDRSNCLRRMH